MLTKVMLFVMPEFTLQGPAVYSRDLGLFKNSLARSWLEGPTTPLESPPKIEGLFAVVKTV